MSPLNDNSKRPIHFVPTPGMATALHLSQDEATPRANSLAEESGQEETNS